MEGAAQKAVVNGQETMAAAAGFRHSLPQMPTMNRNPKIAQSKAATKPDVIAVEHSTTEVEGVGKVFHIGSLLFCFDFCTVLLLVCYRVVKVCTCVCQFV